MLAQTLTEHIMFNVDFRGILGQVNLDETGSNIAGKLNIIRVHQLDYSLQDIFQFSTIVWLTSLSLHLMKEVYK